MASLVPSRPSHECRVCGATTNVRKNFGVPSCVSCRIFYSRNAAKTLICYQNGSCRIEGASRKSCAACRFEKCTRAGMRKSRERRSGRWLSAAAASFVPKAAPADIWGFGQPALDLARQQRTGLNRGLFAHLFHMAEMFRAPFDCDPAELLVADTRSGLRLLETLTRRALAVIRFLPHFAQLDRGLVSVMVSEKIGGLCALLRALHYQPASGHLAVATLSGLEARQPLAQAVAWLFADLLAGERPLLGVPDVAGLVRSLMRLYEQCLALFQDRLGVGVVLLLGVYFYQPDFSAVCGAPLLEAQLRAFQAAHIHWLREFLAGAAATAADAEEAYSRALLLVAEVKRIDFHHCLLARHAQLLRA